MSSIAQVIQRSQTQYTSTYKQLCEYLSYPAISCSEKHIPDIWDLAHRLVEDLKKIGLQKSRLLTLDKALPIVAAEWKSENPNAPTVLIYGHFDLQPVQEAFWETPPHRATQIGDRLYARGAADDMGGWMSHIAAISAWIVETGDLPCHIKLIIEGEEEIGSPNLEQYMDAFPDAFEADVMILTDCENPSTNIPGLTVSLRGLMEIELTVEALSAEVHSGLWGGVVPDVSIALMQLVSSLVDKEGRLLVGRQQIDPEQTKWAWQIPLSEEVIRKGAHLIDEVSPLPNKNIPPAQWLWWQPSMTVLATTFPTYAEKKNALRKKAAALLSIRLAPNQTPEEMESLLKNALCSSPPGGVEVSLKNIGRSGEGWHYTPKGPAFEAANRAYKQVWGHELIEVGVGGSIPFVALFGKRFRELPLILNGVMDPETTAHGPNESLHLGIFKKAIETNVYLYQYLGDLGKNGVR